MLFLRNAKYLEQAPFRPVLGKTRVETNWPRSQCRKSRKTQYVLDNQNRLDKLEKDIVSFHEANGAKQPSENSHCFIPLHEIDNLSFWREHSSVSSHSVHCW